MEMFCNLVGAIHKILNFGLKNIKTFPVSTIHNSVVLLHLYWVLPGLFYGSYRPTVNKY